MEGKVQPQWLPLSSSAAEKSINRMKQILV